MKIRLRAVLMLVSILVSGWGLYAHPMPYSVMLLDVKGDGIAADLKFPLKELQAAFPEEDIDLHPLTLLDRKGNWLDDYLRQHMSIADASGHRWSIAIEGKTIAEDEQNLTGKYHELIYQLWLQPPGGSSPRHFTMYYDAIMHQVVTHKLWIKIRSDWSGGMTASDSLDAELGLLGVDFTTNTVPPVVINLDEGNAWVGLQTMVSLGMGHIAEGTDHLLFLLVLLLPAALVVENRRWARYGGARYSIIRLIKIATAFTIGHSLSLLCGALQWIVLPQQPIEIAIAVTIFLTAIHAIKPLFWGKEMYVALGFGIVHGLAFSTALTELHLDPSEMALSILGFNVGVELMQLFVILCTFPWLVMLAKNNALAGVRIGGALIAIIASGAWALERISQQPNFVSSHLSWLSEEGKWIILGLALLAISIAIVAKMRSLSISHRSEEAPQHLSES